jgi:hypothetical protein
MLALVPTDGSDPLVEVGEAPDPPTAPDEALIQIDVAQAAALPLAGLTALRLRAIAGIRRSASSRTGRGPRQCCRTSAPADSRQRGAADRPTNTAPHQQPRQEM